MVGGWNGRPLCLKENAMKKILGILLMIAFSLTGMAQNFKAYEQNYTSPPNTGTNSAIRHHHTSWGGAGVNGGGNGFNGPGIGVNGPGWTGNGFGPNVPMWGQSPGMMTGSPWGPGAFSGPDNIPSVNFNNGISHLVAVGYDAQGVWETIPIIVQWQWGGAFYDVTVMDAWNPWTRAWDGSLDISAYQTSYVLRGVTYDWYVNLSTGTYYFNL